MYIKEKYGSLCRLDWRLRAYLHGWRAVPIATRHPRHPRGTTFRTGAPGLRSYWHTASLSPPSLHSLLSALSFAIKEEGSCITSCIMYCILVFHTSCGRIGPRRPGQVHCPLPTTHTGAAKGEEEKYSSLCRLHRRLRADLHAMPAVPTATRHPYGRTATRHPMGTGSPISLVHRNPLPPLPP